MIDHSPENTHDSLEGSDDVRKKVEEGKVAQEYIEVLKGQLQERAVAEAIPLVREWAERFGFDVKDAQLFSEADKIGDELKLDINVVREVVKKLQGEQDRP